MTVAIANAHPEKVMFSACFPRYLSPAIILLPALICGAPALAGPDVGFVSAMQGRPQVLTASGRLQPMALMQTLAPGAMIVLRPNESLRFCHESASKIYRIEGAGAVYVGDVGINTEPGGSKVVEIGICNSTATPSETGGVLLRSFRPPSSPK